LSAKAEMEYTLGRERMSPGGLRGLQIRWGALNMSPVGSTPMRSRQKRIDPNSAVKK